MGVLVEMATRMLRQAEQLETQLQNAHTALPSLAAGSPALYPHPTTHPDIFTLRNALARDGQDFVQLVLGPAEVLRSIVGPQHMQQAVLHVVEELDIVAHVPPTQPITFSALASDLGVDAELLERILRFAFSFHLFQEKPLGHVSHTALSEAVPMLSGWSRLLLRPQLHNALFALPQELQQPPPPHPEMAPKVTLPWNIGNNTDKSFFEVISAADGGLEKFSHAMESHAQVTGGTQSAYFLDGFDWASLGSGPVIDVGGGNGHIAIAIAGAYPELHMIIQDLPTNADAAKKTIPANLQSRVTFQAHDFFEPQPKLQPDTGTGVDTPLRPKAYFLKSVLHDWSDADCVRILKHFIPAVVNDGARIFIIDRMPPKPGHVPNHYETINLFSDLLMHSLLGAKERTEEQWQTVLAQVDVRLRILRLEQPVGSEYGMTEIGV